MSGETKAKVWHEGKTISLARSLLGMFLVRQLPGEAPSRHLITEVEAYDGERDLACHASKGRTGRTEVLYETGGIWYVYLCYGIHEMLNLVVGPKDWPAALLIRGVEGTSGPGRVTKALRIDRQLNGKPEDAASGLHLEAGVSVPRKAILVSPRIGVDYAGPVWSLKPWRFRIDPAVLPALLAGLRAGQSLPVTARLAAPAHVAPAVPNAPARSGQKATGKAFRLPRRDG